MCPPRGRVQVRAGKSAAVLIAALCTACSVDEPTHLVNPMDCEIVSEVNRSRDAILSTMGEFPQGDTSYELYRNEQLDKYRHLGGLYDDASRSVTTQRLSQPLADIASGFGAVVDFSGCDQAVNQECLVELNDKFGEINQRIDEVDEFCRE